MIIHGEAAAEAAKADADIGQGAGVGADQGGIDQEPDHEALVSPVVHLGQEADRDHEASNGEEVVDQGHGQGVGDDISTEILVKSM
mgnify:FL=1